MQLKPHVKFTYAEMKYFSMWWQRQDQNIKDKVRQWVKEGRWEFINGGWSEHDEACPSYEDMLDNMITGHSFLLKEFGVKPRTAWLIDSFGHSSANARLYADMGFDSLFVARLDAFDAHKRWEKDHSMNFLWRPFTKHFGDQHQILVSAFKDEYNYIPGFISDAMQEVVDEPFVTDRSRPTFNAEKRANQLINYI